MTPENDTRPHSRSGALTPGELLRLRSRVAVGFYDHPSIRREVALRLLQRGDLDQLRGEPSSASAG